MKKILSFILSIIIFTLSFDISAVRSEAASVDLNAFSDFLYTHASNYEQNINVTKYIRKYGWTLEDLKRYSGFTLLEKPEMYFVSYTFRVGYTSDGTYYVMFNYLYSESKREQMDSKLRDAAKKAAAEVTEKMSDAEKALIVHDYIISNCKYDQTHTRYSAYDCLVNGSAVCQGYSLAYKYVLENYCGIKCSTVVSDSQNHVWNYVRINGKWYHVDLTTDDASFKVYGGEQYDGFGEVQHKNLLLSDKMCQKSSDLHRNWEVVGGYGKASDTTFDNFFWYGSTSRIYYDNGLYYFVKDDISGSDLDAKKGSRNIKIDLCSYSFRTGSTRLLQSFSSVWYVMRNQNNGRVYEFGTASFKRSFSKIAVVNGSIYVNTSKNIFRYDIKTKKTKKVYTLNKGDRQIYSLVYNGNNKLRICYKYDISYSDNYLNLSISA